jgi:hypothetical protein
VSRLALDISLAKRHNRAMGESRRSTRRVLVEDLRGNGAYLRVTWHPDGQAFVVSHWDGAVCVAATRVDVHDAPNLISVLADGLGDALAVPSAIPATAAALPTHRALMKARWKRVVASLGLRRAPNVHGAPDEPGDLGMLFGGDEWSNNEPRWKAG